MTNMKSYSMLILLLIAIQLFALSLSCICPHNRPSPPVDPEKKASFTPGDEIISGQNHGKLIQFGGLMVLRTYFPYVAGTRAITAKCPPGFRIPTGNDFRSILASIGGNSENAFKNLTSPDGLNLTSSTIFISTTKTADWTFQTMALNTKAAAMSSSWMWQNTAPKALCVRDKDSGPGILFPPSGVIKGQPATIKLDTTSSNGVVWKLNDKIYKSDHMTLTFNDYGCHIIEAWSNNISNEIGYSCKLWYVKDRTIFNDETRIRTLAKIKFIDTGIKPVRTNMLYFSRTNAPLSPALGGGFYVGYTTLNENPNFIHILKYKNDYTLDYDKSTGLYGTVTDIAATAWGFFILVEENERFILYGIFDENGEFSFRFKRIIFEVAGRAKFKEQICIYEVTGAFTFGSSSMFKPDSGKIFFADGFLIIAIAHYNNFNVGSGEDNHTFDGLYVFDENGNDIRYAWTRATSHSLIQSLGYDGEFFYYAGLGDAYPQNVNVAMIDTRLVPQSMDGILLKYNQVFHRITSNTVPQGLPGDAGGNSCGRFAGAFFDPMRYRYGFVYSVKPCNIKKDYKYDEIGIIQYNFSGFNISGMTKYVIPGLSAINIRQIRVGKYGKNLLISYSEYRDFRGTWTPGFQDGGQNQQVFFVLVTMEGIILDGPIKSDEMRMSISDDMRVLSDGSLTWTSITEDGRWFINYAELDKK